eukprot:CAMPEP_0197396498 /NCGR_PEP_ID=MMETSP1165-20131217/9681_1 /TAXON_ID=284809 /ORGANISM="Chrysocystis fragilis, Strain CCMP3189" /LENGTH=72 /DNA_ID=CAMNT_0042922331 /DNA_START=69 /DNA_END=284 /DNA_ORIENTATION=+
MNVVPHPEQTTASDVPGGVVAPPKRRGATITAMNGEDLDTAAHALSIHVETHDPSRITRDDWSGGGRFTRPE